MKAVDGAPNVALAKDIVEAVPNRNGPSEQGVGKLIPVNFQLPSNGKDMGIKRAILNKWR